MADTDVRPETDTASISGHDLRRLRAGARGAGPLRASYEANRDKNVASKEADLAAAKGREGRANGGAKNAAKADREAAEAALAAEVAKPDSVLVTQ